MLALHAGTICAKETMLMQKEARIRVFLIESLVTIPGPNIAATV
jgi:hypothetical protein